MKKLLLSLLTIMLVALFVSCTKDAADGFNAGYEGYTFIGKYDSASDCSEACEYYGYSYYRYNIDLNNCYCK